MLEPDSRIGGLFRMLVGFGSLAGLLVMTGCPTGGEESDPWVYEGDTAETDSAPDSRESQDTGADTGLRPDTRDTRQPDTRDTREADTRRGVDTRPPDADDDGVPDAKDNCPETSNPGQANQDGDRKGDACDEDLDGDQVPNSEDNCPAGANPKQEDLDEDGRGDICDPDVDGDGVDNGPDNCPRRPNPDQRNRDGDSKGNACDSRYRVTDSDVVIDDGGSSTYFGARVDLAGDINGDGLDDVLVVEDRFQKSNKIHIFYGRSQFPKKLTPADADVTIVRSASSQSARAVASGVGDVNGDGFDDIVVGAPRDDTAATDAGAVYLFYGSAGMASSITWSQADARFLGAGWDAGIGRRPAGAGDVNGDGFDDFVFIGHAQRQIDGQGAAHLIFGGAKMTGKQSIAKAGAVIESTIPYFLMDRVVGVGDLDGDGLDDVAVASLPGSVYSNDDFDRQNNPGEVRLFLGKQLARASYKLAAADVRLIGEHDNDRLGFAIDGNTDFNGDGFDDLFVGAPKNNAAGVEAGKTYMTPGGMSLGSTIDLSKQDAWTGNRPEAQMGNYVRSAGDVDGDGYGDLWVVEPERKMLSGAIHLKYGRAHWNGQSTAQRKAITLVGHGTLYFDRRMQLDGGGDVNGDGAPDMVVTQSPNSYDQAKANVYLFLGPMR
jgi:hypothetical protein